MVATGIGAECQAGSRRRAHPSVPPRAGLHNGETLTEIRQSDRDLRRRYRPQHPISWRARLLD